VARLSNTPGRGLFLTWLQDSVARGRYTGEGLVPGISLVFPSNPPSGSLVDSLVIACSSSMLCPYYLLVL